MYDRVRITNVFKSTNDDEELSVRFISLSTGATHTLTKVSFVKRFGKNILKEWYEHE